MPYDPAEMTPERAAELEAFTEELGLRVQRPALINQALTHRSYAFENPPADDNERLEFLGDSVMGFIIAEYFYQRFPEASEGELSKKKARVVSRALLGRVAATIDLGPHIRLGRGEERTGGRKRHSLLGSSLEALIGAVYLSEGFEATADFLRDRLLDHLLAMLEKEEEWDFKSRLQEYAQKRFQTTPRYETVAVEGPDHNKTFTVGVSIQGKVWGEASERRKKTAENQAARAALEAIEGATEGGDGNKGDAGAGEKPEEAAGADMAAERECCDEAPGEGS